MATCVVSGTFLNPSEVAISGATVKFNIATPVLNPGGAVLSNQEVSTTTASDGTWSLTLSRGVTGTITLLCPPDGLNSAVRYTFAISVPVASTANFSSIWVDSQTQ